MRGIRGEMVQAEAEVFFTDVAGEEEERGEGEKKMKEGRRRRRNAHNAGR